MTIPITFYLVIYSAVIERQDRSCVIFEPTAKVYKGILVKIKLGYATWMKRSKDEGKQKDFEWNLSKSEQHGKKNAFGKYNSFTI